MQTLLVEDNARLSAALVRGLRESNLAVEAVTTGRSALERMSKAPPAAMILDLGLPDVDGLEVLASARRMGITAPVLVLSARDALGERVHALDLGADDYLTKPFAFVELVARLRALLRRSAAPASPDPLCFADLRVEPDVPRARLGERTIALSPREHGLLQHLVRRGTGVSTRRDILNQVFGYAFDPGTNVIDVHVAHLRRKLDGGHVQIETVRGKGYRLQQLGHRNE